MEATDANESSILSLEKWPTSGESTHHHFMTAAVVDARGQRQKVIEHYRKAARSPYREGFAAMLSWIRLREIGEDPFKLTPYYAGIEAGDAAGAK